MKVVKIRDHQIDQMGQEMGDNFVLMAKSYFAAMDALKEIVGLAHNQKVNERALQLNKELEELSTMYGTEGFDS